jgi:hypothetical protein
MTNLNETWRKGTRSDGDSACVEVRKVGGMVEVRDTKDRTGSVLKFTEREWVAFTGGVMDGEFEF